MEESARANKAETALRAAEETVLLSSLADLPHILRNMSMPAYLDSMVGEMVALGERARGVRAGGTGGGGDGGAGGGGGRGTGDMKLDWERFRLLWVFTASQSRADRVPTKLNPKP